MHPGQPYQLEVGGLLRAIAQAGPREPSGLGWKGSALRQEERIAGQFEGFAIDVTREHPEFEQSFTAAPEPIRIFRQSRPGGAVRVDR